jgi:hypothetical protein
MNLQDKQELRDMVGHMANDLGYQVARLSTGADAGEAFMAHAFSNAVDQLRNFQRMLAQRVAREAWIAANIPDDAQSFGGAVVVEHRFIGDIAQGAANDGLEVE